MDDVAQSRCGNYCGERKRQNAPKTRIERFCKAFGFPYGRGLGRNAIVCYRDRAIRARRDYVDAAKTKRFPTASFVR
jgi:hypothetical protein